MDANMSSITERVKPNGVMSPSCQPPPSSCFYDDMTSTLLPNIPRDNTVLTPCYIDLMTSFEDVKDSMLTQDVNAFEFMQYLDPISPLSFFLDDDAQNCEVPNISEQNIESKFIAFDTTLIHETGRATPALGIQANSGEGCKRRVVKEKPTTLQQGDWTG
jgi:hypothetical protein